MLKMKFLMLNNQCLNSIENMENGEKFKIWFELSYIYLEEFENVYEQWIFFIFIIAQMIRMKNWDVNIQ